ncbi:hypothetical protein HO173_012293 [Letharia columbiana]|uniref:Uncharacterized protein n=1 Tax=Letharia columbiana TaxID=112416 RepID=A0A8H6FGA4_9LECA|nr:uncharacterized protein HO173_012293 [Letharia columbiana]KAF6226789.1 hypothetical protein HO173_012293 [Letharia columbiana]
MINKRYAQRDQLGFKQKIADHKLRCPCPNIYCASSVERHTLITLPNNVAVQFAAGQIRSALLASRVDHENRYIRPSSPRAEIRCLWSAATVVLPRKRPPMTSTGKTEKQEMPYEAFDDEPALGGRIATDFDTHVVPTFIDRGNRGNARTRGLGSILKLGQKISTSSS